MLRKEAMKETREGAEEEGEESSGMRQHGRLLRKMAEEGLGRRRGRRWGRW